MSELNKKIKTIINDLEKNIENKEELDYVKNQVYNVALLFVEEIDRLMQMIVDNGENIMQVNSNLDSRMSKIEKKLQNIEKEIFLEDEFDFEITCPYCNHEFVEEFSEKIEGDIRCPECNNVIEFDWIKEENEECDHHNCGNCNGDCKHHNEDEEN